MSMDRTIVDKRFIKPKHLKIAFPAVLILALILFIIFRNPTSTYRTEKDKTTIEQVFKGPFQDFIRINGNVEPISVVSLEALEAGRVERILIDEGSMVKKGDVILTLRNENLNMSFTDKASSYAFLTNELNNQLIAVKQQELSDKQDLLTLDNDISEKKRKLEKTARLFAKEGVSEEEYLSLKNSYETAVKYREIKEQKMILDAELRVNKRTQIELNMKMIKQQLDNLNVKAPVDGQLSSFNAEIGQSISKGQSLGEVHVLTSYKITASIDEHYIDRVKTGLEATFERQSEQFDLVVAKVYPQVNEGQFKVELKFESALPLNIRSGQSYNISLQLGETEQAVQIARGGFFQSTGGQWVYVLSADGAYAVKRNIRIGKQNPQFYEILEGLKPGEKIITSSYEMFGNNDKISFK
jgi:HlyD family secretion protein